MKPSSTETYRPRLIHEDPDVFSWNPDSESIARRHFHPLFHIIEQLGAGGVASVFKAVPGNDMNSEVVALKVIHSKLSGDVRLIDQFFKEIRLVSECSHECVVEIKGAWGHWYGMFYYAMKWINGQTLSERIENKEELDRIGIIKIINRILDGLCHVHEKRIIHRDLKPSNIMLEEKTNTPIICDFGMATLLRGAAELLNAFPGGTYEYMPPEQIENMRIANPRIDIYPIGLIGLELFGIPNKPPLFSGSPEEILEAKRSVTYNQIHALNNVGLESRLIDVLIKAILPNPVDRWPSAKIMQVAISRCI